MGKRMSVPSPYEALKKLLALLDEIDSSHCQICVSASEVTSECPKDDKRWKRALKDARDALRYASN
jgi:hypothetical protein